MPILSQLTDKYPLQAVPLLSLQVAADNGPEQMLYYLVGDLGRRCSELGAADAWQELLQQLRWASLLVRSVPLAAGSNVLLNASLSDRARLLGSGVSDTILSDLANRIADVLHQLSSQLVSPLMAALRSHIMGRQAGPARVAVLAYDRKLVPAIKASLESISTPYHAEVTVGDWPALSQGPVLDEIYIFGSLRSLPAGIYKSGQGRAYTRIAYAWARPDPIPQPWFDTYPDYEESIWDSCRFAPMSLGNDHSDSTDVSAHDVISPPTSEAPGEQDAYLIDPTPESDWLAPLTGAREIVRARPIYLSGNRVLYLGTGLREDVFVLRQDSLEVREIPIMELHPGDCLVVPEAANRDYRRQLIDQRLGKAHADCRKRQGEWKGGLADAISKRGIKGVIRELQALGCKRANANNLYNWAYGSVICPQRDADFAAIMSYLGHTREYGQKSHALLRRILSASHQVSDIMLAEMRKALARLDGRSLAQLDESPLTLALGSGRLRFRLMRVTGVGPVTSVARGDYEIITNR